MISAVLRGLGIDTIEVGDAETALAICRERDPSVMVVDVRLPGMDGTDLVHSLRHDGPSNVPILLISAHGEPTEHEADLFLPKPFDIEDLAALVSILVSETSQDFSAA
jgi:DNA-binding response OmpR family regulator